MNDQRGNVIDGTERAHHWRRPPSRPAPDASETRSDAPKSFAGSLLVPADMLPAIGRPDPADETGGPGTPVAGESSAAGETTPDGGRGDQNPFLLPDAAIAARGVAVARRRPMPILMSLAGRLARVRWWRGGRYARAHRPGLREHGTKRLPGAAMVILGAAVLAVAGAWAVMGTTGGTARPTSRPHADRVVPAPATDDAALYAAAAAQKQTHQAGHRLPTQRAARTRPRPRHKLLRSRSASRPRRQPSVTHYVVSAIPQPHPATAVSSGSSSAVAGEAVRPATAHVSAASTAAPTPAGPSGPGGTVGSNCNPKCS